MIVRAHLNFLIAMTMRYERRRRHAARQRVPDYLKMRLTAGKQSDWYDDALFYYAEWMNNTGSMRQRGRPVGIQEARLHKGARALSPAFARVLER
jgi:hypothetical protein